MWSGYGDVSSTVGFFNLIGNIAIFIPLGIFLQLFHKNKRITPCLAWVFSATLAIELLQLLTGLGIFDVDDLILNFFGGFIGIFLYRQLLRAVHDESKVETIIKISGFIFGLPVVVYTIVGTIFRTLW